MPDTLTPAATVATPAAPWHWILATAVGAAAMGAGGAALYLSQHHEATVPAAAVAVAPAAPASASVAQAPAPVLAAPAAPHSKSNRVPARVHTAQSATKSIANQPATEVADATHSAPKAPVWETPVAHPACAGCGTVESVTPMAQEAQPSGLGAVAGAVLGGLLGNQVGGGDGKTLATIGGVLGGAYAGNTVEKRMHQQTSYRVLVRMDDGSTRSVEQGVPTFGVGARVRVQGNVLSPVAATPGQGT